MASIHTLTQELMDMSRNAVSPMDPCERAVYLYTNNTARAADIGKRLNELGGVEAMRYAIYEVQKLGSGDECELQHVWDGIGQWKS